MSAANIEVLNGLSDRSLGPKSQLIILGQTVNLTKLDYTKVEPKFGGLVSAEVFKSGSERLKVGADSCIPLYFNDCQLVGLSGKHSRHSTPSQQHLITKLMRAVVGSKQSVSIVVHVSYGTVLATVCGVARAFPMYSRKSRVKEEAQRVSIELILTDEDKKLEKEDVVFLESMVYAVRSTARLVDTPCNELNTETMMREAVDLAHGLPETVQRTIIKGEDLREQGFGGLYHVGKAAEFPPALVVLSYSPSGATQSLALVGKGIVYDTGGMQIKTKTGMPGMKRDMGGAAAVLFSFWSLVRAGYGQTLHAVLCLAENNIGPTATKPDDIITMLSGKTVEINNTDAEGRLVLGDGVYYAHNVLKVNRIIDMATLTGAQLTATGAQHAAIVTNSDSLERKTVIAGRISGDLVHPLPFAPDLHFDYLSSSLADMKNSALGKSDAGSAVASLFIAAQIDFRPEVEWLHVDLAAPVHVGDRATGYGPPLILTLLADQTQVPLLKAMSGEQDTTEKNS